MLLVVVVRDDDAHASDSVGCAQAVAHSWPDEQREQHGLAPAQQQVDAANRALAR